MEDDLIIALYWERSEQAIQETDKKYGKLCFRLANQILQQDEDAEECVSDTFLKVWNSIPDDRPAHFSAYLCKITKRLALSKYRYYTAEKRQTAFSVSLTELSGILSGGDDPEAAYTAKELSDSIAAFLRKESPQNRMIFLRRYWHYDPVETIAQEFQLRPQTVASTLCRIRKRLKKHLEKEGFIL